MTDSKCFLLAVGAELLTAAAAASDISVYDDGHKIGLCLVGAIIGSFLTIAAFPADKTGDPNNLRRLSLKFGASSAGSIGIAPAIIEYFNMSRTNDMLVAVSVFTAVFVVSGIQIIAPRLEKLVLKWFKVE